MNSTTNIICSFVSWYFQPSQPQKNTSGLKIHFNLSPTDLFHKTLHNESLFLKPQHKFYPQFWNTNPEKQQHMFKSQFIFCGHSTWEPASSRVTYFYSVGLHRNRCQPQLIQENFGRGFGKDAGEWTRRVKISKEEIPGSRCSMYGYILTYSRL